MKIKQYLFSIVFLTAVSCDFIEERQLANESTLSRVLKDPLSKNLMTL